MFPLKKGPSFSNWGFYYDLAWLFGIRHASPNRSQLVQSAAPECIAPVLGSLHWPPSLLHHRVRFKIYFIGF